MLEEVTRAGLAAILPVYKNGNVTKLITYDGKERIDVRTCRTVLKNIARIYGADLTALRKMYGRPLNKSYSIPIPFSLDMVLMPIKVRKKPLGNNDGTLGYINYNHIETLKNRENGNCQILLKNGLFINTEVKKSTVKEHMKNARFVQNLYREKHLVKGNIPLGDMIREDLFEEDRLRTYLLELLIGILTIHKKNQ